MQQQFRLTAGLDAGFAVSLKSKPMQTEPILDMPLFRNCDIDTAARILEKSPGRYTSYKNGDIIAMQGYACRAVLLLSEGSAYAKMISEEGKEFTLDTLSAPETLASAFVFSTEGTFPVTIIASGQCGIWSLGRETLRKLVAEDRNILDNYLRIISDHSMFLSRRLNEFALQTLSSRIISYIEHNGTLSNIQEAAFILGVDRPSLSRALSQLMEQGAIVKTAGGYTIA